MGAPYTVSGGNITYTVIDDLVISYDACIVGSLVDEVDGSLLRVAATVTADLPGLFAGSPGTGLFGFACYTDIVFQNLATTPYPLNVTIAAPGYRTRTIPVTIPTGTVLPYSMGAIAMRALTVRLQGRVVAEATRSPIGGATVLITTPKVAALRTGAYFDHAAPVNVDAVSVTPLGAGTTLKVAAPGTSSSITVMSVAGIGAGTVLQIGPDVNADFATVTAADPQSGRVTLGSPINSTFPAGAAVQPVTITPTGPTTKLSRDANAGDGLLLLLATLAATAVRINDGANTEYHVLSAQTDADGYYHLNGVGGVASVAMTALATGFTDLNETYAIAYTSPLNVLDFRLQP